MIAAVIYTLIARMVDEATEAFRRLSDFRFSSLVAVTSFKAAFGSCDVSTRSYIQPDGLRDGKAFASCWPRVLSLSWDLGALFFGMISNRCSVRIILVQFERVAGTGGQT
jgi:hypothetical protein